MAEHKLSKLLRYAADNEDARFQYKREDGTWTEVNYSLSDVLYYHWQNWRIYQPPKPDVVEYANDYTVSSGLSSIGIWSKKITSCNSHSNLVTRTGIIRRTINGETGKASYCAVDENGEEV